MDDRISNQNIGRHNSVLFKITSRCNDNCSFCLEYDFIKAKRPQLTLEEFKRNYLFLKSFLKKRRSAIDYVILSGGEPTLHPDFFKMLLYLKGLGEPFRFITNLISFNKEDFLNKLIKIYSQYKNDRQKGLSKFIASINDLPEKTFIAQQRFSGLVKALEAGLPVIVTVMIYQGNVKELPLLASRLKTVFKEKSRKDFLQIEFRSIYIENTPEKLLESSLSRDISQVRNSIEKCIKILDTPSIEVTLWGFPLCYLSNYQKAKNRMIKKRQSRRIIKVSKDLQLGNVEVRNWEKYLKSNKDCHKCKLRYCCSGIDKLYLDKNIYPSLKPF